MDIDREANFAIEQSPSALNESRFVREDVVLSTPSITVHASGNPFRDLPETFVTRFTTANLAEPLRENCYAKIPTLGTTVRPGGALNPRLR